MASMTEITCKCGCGRNRIVRTADVKRGWGKFFDKSCKAKEQGKRTGQYKSHMAALSMDEELGTEDIGHLHQSGYFGHGQD